MPGHNHYSNCGCGWCLKTRAATKRDPGYWFPLETPSFDTYGSFTIPNAACPVCGAAVFFYRSPAGGRVFFDELGPPWPKHPCTDNGRSLVRRLSSDSVEDFAPPSWDRAGWVPVKIRYSRLEGNRHILAIEDLASGERFNILAEAPFQTWIEVAAFMKRWDRDGQSQISIIELAARRSHLFKITRL